MVGSIPPTSAGSRDQRAGLQDDAPANPVDNAARCPQRPTTATMTHFAEDPGHNFVQELAEAPGARACIRLVSGASGKECAGGGGHIGPR
jgi:hypothetical protein